ncbi:MAG: hypothetical protein IKO32_02550 [Lachnospiraceae bacterium]|nr:hypothetical protein [Lachnospiraceae bacterium]
MYTSDKKIKISLQHILNGLIATTACAVFGGIYEQFSHGVYSNYMIYAFLIPLMLSVFPAFVFLLIGKIEVPDAVRTLWNLAVATLTVGCIFKGVLEIYGTTNRLMIVYPAVVAGFMAAAVTMWVRDGVERRMTME